MLFFVRLVQYGKRFTRNHWENKRFIGNMKVAKKILSSNGSPMLSARKVAKRLGCASDYVGKLCREGKLQGARINNVWFVDQKSIKLFEAQRAQAKIARAEELAQLRRSENKGLQSKAVLPEIVPAPHVKAASVAHTLVEAILRNSATRGAAVLVGSFLLFVAAAFAAQGSNPISFLTQGSLSASLAQIDSPFFGAHPMSISLWGTSSAVTTSTKASCSNNHRRNP